MVQGGRAGRGCKAGEQGGARTGAKMGPRGARAEPQGLRGAQRLPCTFRDLRGGPQG